MAGRIMEASAEKELGWEFAGGHNFHDLHPEADGDKIHDPPRESNKTLRGRETRKAD
jgi:hypothetical protein